MPGTDVIEHKIEVTSEKPNRLRVHRTTPAARAQIERQLDEMLEQGVISESDSPWSAPVLLVKNANGDQRMVFDFRQVNQVTVDKFQSLPTIDEIFDCMAESHPTIFSSLDLFSGYLRIPMEESSKKYTGFTKSQHNHYSFNFMLFGLKGSFFTFIAMMQKISRNIIYRYILCYMDDLVCYSSNMADHLIHLEEVFKRLRAARLRLNPKKCKFALSEIKFLSHVVNKDGISIDHSKDAAISDFPRPKNVKQVRRYLGICNYWRRYVKNYSEIISPLNKLLQKSVIFV